MRVSLGRFRFSATAADSNPMARTYDDAIAAEIRETQPSATTDSAAFRAFLLASPELAEHVQKIRKLTAPEARTTTLIMQERPTEHPRPTFRHHRGEYLQPKNRVQPQLPEVLATPGQQQPQNRLQFAEWLVSADNPLTARVVANRQWAAFFGTGLVKTVDDFGLQGETPSHPELLDWLAVVLRDDDEWQIRHLHRRIVCSATYQQSAMMRHDAREVDPDNRLLSYSPRYRLDAETVRDQLLVASGILNRKLGGPPVRPPQPTGVTEVAYGGAKWQATEGADRYRRSLYTFTKRTAPFAMLSTFDAPSGEACIAQRDRSNSPLQALTLLNDVMIIEFAQQAGKSAALRSTETDQVQSAVQLFRSVLIRQPTDAELSRMTDFLAIQRSRFQQAPELARSFTGAASSESDGIVSEIAAWTALARSLFSLDEVLTRS